MKEELENVFLLNLKKDKDYDLSISKYQEIEYEQKEHRPSKDILKDIKDNLSEELNEIEELERLI
jgi:type I restriction enzyme M protein